MHNLIELAHPWLLITVLLPWAVNALVRPHKESSPSLQVPFFQRLVDITQLTPSEAAVVPERKKIQRVFLAIAWLLLVVALAKPEYLGAPIVLQKSGRDLMIAVDLSNSMEARDFRNDQGENVDRLSAVKSVLKEFVNQRRGDRLGLIVFGDAPYLQAPFTEDHKIWLSLLDETGLGMAGPSTAIGDAIGLAIHFFQTSDTQHRVLIILTDGNDTHSKLPPVDAAKVAQQFGVKIYTIAIGDPSTLGEQALDTEVLAAIASATGGGYFEALNRAELQASYQSITALEPSIYQSNSYQPRTTLHHYLLGLVVCMYMGLLVYLRVQKNRNSRVVSSDV